MNIEDPAEDTGPLDHQGRLLIPRKGPPITIVNDRPKVGRNKRVSINGVVTKLKRSVAARLPIPFTEIRHNV